MKKILKSLPIFILALLFLYPVYWSLVGSFMTDSEIMSIPPKIFTFSPTFSNYIELFVKAPALRWLFNSLFVSIVTCVLVVLFGTMAGYGFSKKKFFARDVLFFVMILGMMIPRQVTLIPMYKMMNSLQLQDTLIALILPQLGIPLGVFLMRQFIYSIPDEIIEAARIDGVGELGVFFRIIMPMSKPGMGALAIFTFLSSWNDYAWQLVIISDTKLKTLPLGVATFQEEFSMRWGLLMAGGILASLPLIAIFLAFQKHFTKGITAGAIKG